MSSGFLQVTRLVRIVPAGVTTLTLPAGAPYKNLTVWAKVTGAGTISVSAQPLFWGANDGSAVAISTTAPTKIKQTSTDEMRPSNANSIKKNAADEAAPQDASSAVQFTNSGLADVVISVYMIAVVCD